MKYPNLTLGTIEAIINKLGGEKEAVRFLRGELLLVPTILPTHTVWKTITIGTHKDVKTLRKALKSGKYRVPACADALLSHTAFKLVAELTEVDLVVCSVRELGFSDSTTYAQICAKAVVLGLELCQAEVGPVLRLYYDNQPLNERLSVAMETFTVWGGNYDIFHVERGKCLGTEEYYPDDVWLPSHRFVFVLPRK